MFLLEAGALHAASCLYRVAAQKARHRRPAGNWLSPVTILFSCVGRSGRPRRLRLSRLPEPPDAASRCLKRGKKDVQE